MKILICGAGIAGLTLAWWLARDGQEVEVVERAKTLGEGYMVDFFGSGWDVAERMGLLAKLEAIHYPIEAVVTVAEDGRERARLPYARMRKTLFDDRAFNFMRGDLVRVLFEALPRRVKVRFGESFESANRARGYDLVVGADGVHSKVRDIMLGATDAERFLGLYTAAYVIKAPDLAEANGNTFRTLTVPQRMVATYTIRDGKLATFFAYDAALHPEGMPSGADALRHVYGDMKWVVPELLARMPAEIFFDTVSQVVLPLWSAPKVTLVGDACQAVSLLAGQGASMAMGGAWALAEEIRRGGQLREVLERYESRVKPAIEAKQRAGRNMAAWFTPKHAWRITVRDLAMRASLIPGMGWIMRQRISRESIVR